MKHLQLIMVAKFLHGEISTEEFEAFMGLVLGVKPRG